MSGKSPVLSERWCSDTRRSYFTDHLGFTGKGAINTPAGEPQPWTPPARPRGSGAGPDRQATPLPRASRPWAWSGPAGCHYWPPSPCLRGTATAGASSVSSTGFADGGARRQTASAPSAGKDHRRQDILGLTFPALLTALVGVGASEVN